MRTGFFEPDDYQAVLSYLRDDVRPAVRFAYLTGWRMKSDIAASNSANAVATRITAAAAYSPASTRPRRALR